MEARQDDVRRALVNARMPVPTCAVMAALQQNPDADADEVIKILRCRDLFIANNRVDCFLCDCGMAAVEWMPHTRGCKRKAKPLSVPDLLHFLRQPDWFLWTPTERWRRLIAKLRFKS